MPHEKPLRFVPLVLSFATFAPAQDARVALPRELGAEIDAVCQPLVDAGLLVGCVVGVACGDEHLVRGYGVRSAGGQEPSATTLFEIGSVSKVFTGVLLASAVVRGEVKLDDAAQTLMPDGVELPKRDDAPMLLWHLATHTSGLPRLPDMEGADPADPYAHFAADRLFEAASHAKLRRAPGTAYEYSNLGVGLLGAMLVRKAGAASFDALLRERITGPLAMADTAVELDAARRERFAAPFDADGSPCRPWRLAALAGAGGIRSTVDDMLRFAVAQFASGDSELDRAMGLAREKRHEGKGGIALGLGWHIARDAETRWHNGETGGFHAWIGVHRPSHVAVCMLANTARGEVDAVAESILRRACGGPAPKPLAIEKPVAVGRAALARLVGEYEMSPEAKFTITLDERGLAARLTGQPSLRIHARSSTEFFYRAVDAALVFELDGEVATAVVLHQNGQEIRCTRIVAATK
ncbi:MAG: serine hydrolase [Planctomycetes bacterium]|nr:serine hydrolase [Planctomycetota bacterium]